MCCAISRLISAVAAASGLNSPLAWTITHKIALYIGRTLNDQLWLLKLACPVDIFGYNLNEYNLGLQGKNNDFFRHNDKISAFTKTLQHRRIRDLQGRIFDSSTIQDIVTRHLDLVQSIKQSINNHLMKTISSWHSRNWNNSSEATIDKKFVGGNSFEVDCSKVKTVSFFWSWVYTDWTFRLTDLLQA